MKAAQHCSDGGGPAGPLHTAAARITGRAKRGRGKPLATATRGLRARAWWVMREKVRFTLDDLLFTLASPQDKDAFGNLRKYVRALELAGVLARLKRREAGSALTSNGRVIWRVACDLGRQAPVWREAHAVVYDPNSGQLLPMAELA